MTGQRLEIIEWLKAQPDGVYEAEKRREKRSLSANAYYHVLLADLAAAIRTDVDALHYEMLSRYPCPDKDENGNPVEIEMLYSIPVTRLPGYWLQLRSGSGRATYLRLKGSSEMNTAEMSRLLDGLISECKEAGIETMTPDELARLKGYEKYIAA